MKKLKSEFKTVTDDNSNDFDANKLFLDKSSNKNKRFVNYLLNVSETNPKMDYSAVEEETQTILVTGSETTAITIGMALIVLGIYPEIQVQNLN